MSTITSASTPAEVWAQYQDNASYDETGDRAKAVLFRTACRVLIGRYRTASAGRDGQSLSLESLQKQLDDVAHWLNVNPDPSAAGRARYFSLENYRG